MKKIVPALLFAAIMLMSCNWELSDDDASLDDVVITTTTETAETVEKISTFKDGVLSSYVVRHISDSTARTVDQEQFYKADGTLKHSWKYGYNAEGLVTTTAYYDAAGDLLSYFAYAYGSGAVVTTQASYDAAGQLLWLRRYETNSAGGIETAASYNGSEELTGALQYFYIDKQEGWNMEVAYGTDTGNLAGDVTVDDPVAGAVNTETLNAEARLSLTLPVVGTLPSPAIPDPASSGLPVSGYRFSLDDDHGNTLVALDENYYPLSGTRTDDRLDCAVSVELEYDDENRIVRKETRYGSTLALGIAIAYQGDTLYPVRVETSGKSMVMPLDYGIEYGENDEVVSVSVYSGDTRIRRFEYDYDAPVVDPPAPADIRGMDPFTFLGDMLTAGAAISEYDGDGALIETFSATSTIGGLTVEVRLPNDEINGRFQILYDDEGNCSSITAYGKDGEVAWREEISLFTDMWDDLETIAAGAYDSAIEYGTMVETMFPDDPDATIAEVQSNFVYNLIF
ncbi:MAG TPA: hypothetical protein PLV73_05205 [Treponemataceae bacterium]|nr:MAG: hypothetical protein BWY20_01198 [Spirochaetes bacterium ADurb.Bin215]HPA10203.1 hypothetical protein [Treponemataceae bacterium]